MRKQRDNITLAKLQLPPNKMRKKRGAIAEIYIYLFLLLYDNMYELIVCCV